AHGNGESKWYFELPLLKYTVSPLLFVCPPFISIHFRTPPHFLGKPAPYNRVLSSATRLV
ncbi:MAG: hypothetical protein ACFN9G_13105, partial [Cardiobacterium sp.]